MGSRQLGLRDVSQGVRPSRLRLLAPLRYLAIRNPEKTAYDFVVPSLVGGTAWLIYTFISPRPALFGASGLLHLVFDVLVMAIPFLVGALASVAMGSPGAHLDARSAGAELFLQDRVLTLRQFVCYLLGYLSFLSIALLVAIVVALQAHDAVLAWTRDAELARQAIVALSTLILALGLAALTVTVLWAVYFLTDIVNDA